MVPFVSVPGPRKQVRVTRGSIPDPARHSTGATAAARKVWIPIELQSAVLVARNRNK